MASSRWRRSFPTSTRVLSCGRTMSRRWTGRLIPLTVDGVIYASSMAMLDSARHPRPRAGPVTTGVWHRGGRRPRPGRRRGRGVVGGSAGRLLRAAHGDHPLRSNVGIRCRDWRWPGAGAGRAGTRSSQKVLDTQNKEDLIGRSACIVTSLTGAYPAICAGGCVAERRSSGAAGVLTPGPTCTLRT